MSDNPFQKNIDRKESLRGRLREQDEERSRDDLERQRVKSSLIRQYHPMVERLLLQFNQALLEVHGDDESNNIVKRRLSSSSFWGSWELGRDVRRYLEWHEMTEHQRESVLREIDNDSSKTRVEKLVHKLDLRDGRKSPQFWVERFMVVAQVDLRCISYPDKFFFVSTLHYNKVNKSHSTAEHSDPLSEEALVFSLSMVLS